jgi:endo-1,4-beta-xylanase
MKINSLFYCAALAAVAALGSCKKGDLNGPTENLGNFTDTAGTLKSLANFPIGMAMLYDLSNSNPQYFNTAKREVSWITFENELKNESVVGAGNVYNFTTADAFYNKAIAAGFQVYGHTLVWHSQQRASYYNTLTGTGAPVAVNLVANPSFETAGSGKLFANWTDLNHSNGTFSVGTGSANVHGGTQSLIATTTAGGNNYNTQIITDAIPVTAGKAYNVTYWIRGNATGSIQFEIRSSTGATDYQNGRAVTTAWSQVSYQYTAPAGATTMQIAYDLGGNANVFYIDDVSVTDATIVPGPDKAQITAAVDAAMQNHINTVVTHYKGKIKAWDVVNEPFTDAGALRNNANTNTPAANNVFVWQEYLGEAYAEKAFRYANAADPAAELYMNDYNLETAPAKLTAFVNLAKKLKAAGVPIAGVGTQLHVAYNTPQAGIDDMFRQLAGTGLKVRITEMDVRANIKDIPAYTLTQYDAAYQAMMFKYIVSSYLKNVPEAQRGGITIWGVNDKFNWKNTANRPDAATLFDANYQKKPAYSGFKQALQGKGLLDY